MTEKSLSRLLATSVIDALKQAGHVLLVKGGAEALTRDLEALMAEHLARVTPHLDLTPLSRLTGEVTSTFGAEAADEAVEQMVSEIGASLMDSDHVEDVFAEDNVIRRDVFRVVRETLLRPPATLEDEEPAGPISVRLETLGYVASTVARRADAETLRDALERAALAAEGELAGYDPGAREATFTVHTGDPDTRLEIEEAVADELSDLVDMGLVDLPTLERRVPLPRPVPPTERGAVRPRLDALAAKTLNVAGCGSSWEFAGEDHVKLIFTPLSEQDGKDVDLHAAFFARELPAAFGVIDRQPGPESPRAPVPAVREAAPPRHAKRDEDLDDEDLDEEDLDDDDLEDQALAVEDEEDTDEQPLTPHAEPQKLAKLPRARAAASRAAKAEPAVPTAEPKASKRAAPAAAPTKPSSKRQPASKRAPEAAATTPAKRAASKRSAAPKATRPSTKPPASSRAAGKSVAPAKSASKRAAAKPAARKGAAKAAAKKPAARKR